MSNVVTSPPTPEIILIRSSLLKSPQNSDKNSKFCQFFPKLFSHFFLLDIFFIANFSLLFFSTFSIFYYCDFIGFTVILKVVVKVSLSIKPGKDIQIHRKTQFIDLFLKLDTFLSKDVLVNLWTYFFVWNTVEWRVIANFSVYYTLITSFQLNDLYQTAQLAFYELLQVKINIFFLLILLIAALLYNIFVTIKYGMNSHIAFSDNFTEYFFFYIVSILFSILFSILSSILFLYCFLYWFYIVIVIVIVFYLAIV